MSYDGPERRQTVRWKVLSDQEIELYLKGERQDIDRLILIALNRLAESAEQQTEKLHNHQQKEEGWMEQVETLGGFTKIKQRADYTDKAILKLEEETEVLREAKKKLILGGIGAILFAVAWVLVYFWNGHMPASAHIPMPKP